MQISPLENELSTKPISIDEAKNWFQQQISTSHANAADDSLMILPNANPNWDSAFSSLNLRNHDFVIAPLQVGGANGRLHTRLMITRKSDGSLMGVKMLYLADQDYHDRRNGDYRTTDFTGNIIYSDLSGRFLFGTRVVNGTEVCAADAAISNRGGVQQVASNGGVTLRECERFRSPTIEICNERGQVFTLDCYNFVITLIWCVSSDLTSRHSGIEPGTILGNGSGNNNNGSNGTDTNVNWGAWQPQNLFSTAQLNQMRTLFYTNQLEDLFELLKATDQQQLGVVNNFIKRSNLVAIAALKKYTDKEYSFYEFNDLYADQSFFAEADNFLDLNNFDSESKKAVKGVQIIVKKNWTSDQYTTEQLEEIKAAFNQEDDPIIGLAIDYFVIDYLTQVAVLKKLHPTWSKYRVAFEASKEALHLALDICGLAPVFGEACDATNGLFYTIQGDGLNASLSFASAIPFAGWAAAGAKLGVKITGVIGNSGRVYRLTYKIVGNVVEFGEKAGLRAQLRRILQTPTGEQAHHLVPLDLWNKDLVQAAAKDKAPFHINEFNNGINMSDLYHNGSHPDYSRRVEKAMKDIYDANGGSNITPHVAQQKL